MRLVNSALPMALISVLALSPLASGAQTKAEIEAALAKDPTLLLEIKDRLAKDPELFVKVATKAMKWQEPAEPFHMGGPLYFVGTQGIGVFLFKTSEGLVLLNTGMPGSGEMIEASIRQLGLDPMDIKLILTSHAHIDHAAGHAYIQKLTGAKVPIIAEEASKLASGGADDFFYGNYEGFRFDAPQIDQIIRDGDTVKLGDMAFTAHHTPGHSVGSTTWTTTIVDGGKIYSVIIPDGMGANPGYRVQVNPSSPGLAMDFRRTLGFLEQQQPDIWLALHNIPADLAARKARVETEGLEAWVDPEGYRLMIVQARRALDDLIAQEVAAQ